MEREHVRILLRTFEKLEQMYAASTSNQTESLNKSLLNISHEFLANASKLQVSSHTDMQKTKNNEGVNNLINIGQENNCIEKFNNWIQTKDQNKRGTLNFLSSRIRNLSLENNFEQNVRNNKLITKNKFRHESFVSPKHCDFSQYSGLHT